MDASLATPGLSPLLPGAGLSPDLGLPGGDPNALGIGLAPLEAPIAYAVVGLAAPDWAPAMAPSPAMPPSLGPELAPWLEGAASTEVLDITMPDPTEQSLDRGSDACGEHGSTRWHGPGMGGGVVNSLLACMLTRWAGRLALHT